MDWQITASHTGILQMSKQRFFLGNSQRGTKLPQSRSGQIRHAKRSLCSDKHRENFFKVNV